MTAVNANFLEGSLGLRRNRRNPLEVSTPGCSDTDAVRFDRNSHQGPLKDELNNKLQLLASWTFIQMD